MTADSLHRGAPLWIGTAVVIVWLGLSAAPVTAKSKADCRLADDPDLWVVYQLDKLAPSAQCQIGQVVNGHTTRGTIGPLETPVTLELYEYLLDRPVITAALVDRLGIGTYRFEPRGHQRYWVEDGEGTEGLVTLVQQHGGRRTYYIEGNHHGSIWPTVHATAVVFMKLEPTPHQATSVSTSLISYARLDDKLLRGLVWLLRPLLEDAITQKLTRGFEATYVLGQRIAEEPARILDEVPTLPFQNAADARRFTSLLPAHATVLSPVDPSRTP